MLAPYYLFCSVGLHHSNSTVGKCWENITIVLTCSMYLLLHYCGPFMCCKMDSLWEKVVNEHKVYEGTENVMLFIVVGAQISCDASNSCCLKIVNRWQNCFQSQWGEVSRICRWNRGKHLKKELWLNKYTANLLVTFVGCSRTLELNTDWQISLCWLSISIWCWLVGKYLCFVTSLSWPNSDAVIKVS